LRIGALAAGAVHELATPLTTMAVLVNEMQQVPGASTRLRDVETLSAQIDVCRQTLRSLMAVAGHASDEGSGNEPLDCFLDSIANTFRKMRPRLHLTCHFDGCRPVPEIRDEPTLKQAILMILNNAADASPDDVRMNGQWSPDHLVLSILDRGKGMPELGREKLGRMFFTTKAPGQGTGLGLVLTVSTVSRLGGTVEWSPRPEGGVCAEIRLPLRGLTTRATP
jgi:two-component system sensor histidine kinase RegB